VNHVNDAPRTRRGPVFWTSVVVGWVVMLAGLRGLLIDAALTQPADLARWFFGVAIVHDLFIAPVAYLCALLIRRVAPRAAVEPLQLGLAASALLVGFAWPLIGGYGRRPSNPTVLPLDYTRNVVVALVAIWAGATVAIVVSALRRTRSSRRETS
jgi:hypothetical protein